MRIKKLQNQDLYPDVLKEILVEYLAKNTEVRCIRKLDTFFHKIEKTTKTIKKAVMKIHQSGHREHNYIPQHFLP